MLLRIGWNLHPQEGVGLIEVDRRRGSDDLEALDEALVPSYAVRLPATARKGCHGDSSSSSSAIAASEPGIGALGGATTVGAVRPAAFRTWASRPISLEAGVLFSSASIVPHISSRVRKPNEQSPRFALIVGSSAQSPGSPMPATRVTAMRYAKLD